MHYIKFISILFFIFLTACGEKKDISNINYQAHRGGYQERPENTMSAFINAWKLGGIPEADIRTTKDNVIIVLHDSNLLRTTVAIESINKLDISELMYEDISKQDAGIKFSEKYKGEKIPRLEDVFKYMSESDKRIYLDLKNVDLNSLSKLIKKHNIESKIIFANTNIEPLLNLKKLLPKSQTMLWIGGSKNIIEFRFNYLVDNSFFTLDQVQLHLYNKGISKSFVKKALDETSKMNIDLEILPYNFSEEVVSELLDIGITWFAVDTPTYFNKFVNNWVEK